MDGRCSLPDQHPDCGEQEQPQLLRAVSPVHHPAGRCGVHRCEECGSQRQHRSAQHCLRSDPGLKPSDEVTDRRLLITTCFASRSLEWSNS